MSSGGASALCSSNHHLVPFIDIECILDRDALNFVVGVSKGHHKVFSKFIICESVLLYLNLVLPNFVSYIQLLWN